MAKTSAPSGASLSDISIPMPRLNVAVEINMPDADPASAQVQYNAVTDQGLASRRSKHDVKPLSRTQRDPLTVGDLPLGTGLSLRMAMAGQGENDQMPFRTDPYGKMRD